jgi:hypothetical protein
MFTKESAINPSKNDDEMFGLLVLALEGWAKGSGTHHIAVLATCKLGKRVSEAEVYNLLAAARDPG